MATICISLIIIRAFTTYCFSLISLFLFVGRMAPLTIEQKKALHAKQKAVRRERWSDGPHTNPGGLLGKGKRKMGDGGTIISTRPLKIVIPGMARYACYTS